MLRLKKLVKPRKEAYNAEVFTRWTNETTTSTFLFSFATLSTFQLELCPKNASSLWHKLYIQKVSYKKNKFAKVSLVEFTSQCGLTFYRNLLLTRSKKQRPRAFSCPISFIGEQRRRVGQRGKATSCRENENGWGMKGQEIIQLK